MVLVLWVVAILQLLLIWKVIAMSAIVSRLTAGVAVLTAAVDSAALLLSNLATEIRERSGDDEALEELATSLEDNSAELTAAVVANTPASAPDESEAQPVPVEQPTTGGDDPIPAPADDPAAEDQA